MSVMSPSTLDCDRQSRRSHQWAGRGSLLTLKSDSGCPLQPETAFDVHWPSPVACEPMTPCNTCRAVIEPESGSTGWSTMGDSDLPLRHRRCPAELPGSRRDCCIYQYARRPAVSIQ